MVLLGTGTPRTEPGRSGPATAVIVDGQPHLFDFGPGVGSQIYDGYAPGMAGLGMSRLTRAFLTHMHSDHTIGLPDLLLTPWMCGREQPLEVYGPRGTSAMTSALADAYALDVAKRLHSEPHAVRGPEVNGFDVIPGVVYRDDLVTVDAFAVQHGDWPEAAGPYPAMGYRVTAADRTVVISGDTGPFDAMVATYDGCDVLVHEVYATSGLASRPPEWQAYHELAHTSATHLGSVAARL